MMGFFMATRKVSTPGATPKPEEVKATEATQPTTAEQAEEILSQEQADLIFLAREILRNPYFSVQTSWESDDDCFYPHQYLRAKPSKF